MPSLNQLLERLKKPVPAWVLIVVIVVVLASVGAWVAYNIFGPKPDFKLQPVQSFQRTFIGDRADFTIRVSSLDNFTGIVTVTTQAPNAQVSVGWSCLAHPLMKRSAYFPNVAGNYSLTVVGQSGRISHSVNLALMVEGVSIRANPLIIDVTRNSTTSTITLTSLSSFPGYLNLSARADGCDSCSATVSPSSVFLRPGGSTNAIVNVTASYW